MKLFRIVSDTGRTEYIVSNDLSQSDATATKQQCQVRWKIEQLHREIKQTTGLANVNVVHCVPNETILRVVYRSGSV